jgi:hypothetical protein
MTWLQPWAAWFLAGIPAIVLLYLLRLKRQPQTVSTLMFWQRVMQEGGRRAFFQRLRNLLSLLLHLLIFLLLLGALARPVWDRFIRDGSATVLILDRRARMQATEPGGRTRFDMALDLARDYARQAGGGREFAFLTLAANPSVTVPFTSDEALLLHGLGQIAPTDATGALDEAIALADALLAARTGHHRIVVLTGSPGGALAKPSCELVTHALGSSQDNVAITRFATRPLPSNPETSEVLLETQNFGRTPVRTEVEIALDGRPLELKPLALAPGERRLDIFTSVPRPALSARGWLTARLSASDALPSDNVAYAALPPARANRVLLVSKGNTFLEKLLGVDTSLKFQFITPEAYQSAMSGKFEAVIFDGFVPANFDLTSADGNFLFLKATPFAGTEAPIEQPLVTEVDASHPATRLVNLQNTTILSAQRLALPASRDGWRFSALLRSGEHPLFIAGERGRQRIAALAFGVLDSDLPLRVAFPLLIHNTLQWISGTRTDPTRALTTGETLSLPPGQRLTAAPLRTQPGLHEQLQPAGITGFFQPLQNGFYRLEENGATRWLPANTFSEAESDLRASASTDTAPAMLPIASAGFRGFPLWQWLAVAAFVLLTAEWWLFHRRKTE